MPGQTMNDAASKKLLVCAPSNAAVDELVMRFKAGIKTSDGVEHRVNIVRLGKSEAMNENVKDVTLDELVSKKLGVGSNDNDNEATQKLFAKHKSVSAQLNEVRQQRDSGESKGEALQKIENEFHTLRKEKAQLGRQIDNAKDDQKLAYRNKDIERRREQERVLRDAHIVCATLSGSGHDMFQNMAIEFETVIVDEAAQCVEMSALIPLKYGCAKCILVGDPKQLPPTVFSKEAAAFQYEQSLFVRMQKNHPHDVHLLDTQYRMHPEISFYLAGLSTTADSSTVVTWLPLENNPGTKAGCWVRTVSSMFKAGINRKDTHSSTSTKYTLHFNCMTGLSMITRIMISARRSVSSRPTSLSCSP
jgi:senataxin